MSSTRKLPNLGEILGKVVSRVPMEQRPLLIAMAERMAAERYRQWASGVPEPASATLLACADREEEIARRVESLFSEASSLRQDLLARKPDLEDLNRSLFTNHPLREQFAIQAQAERIGAATWRSFASLQETSSAAEVYLACAALEEESATTLDSLLASGLAVDVQRTPQRSI